MNFWDVFIEEAGDRASDRAYALLKKMIITLDLAPGEPVKADDLMVQLGIGRTPVREALHRLAQENLVLTIPRRGTVVADVSLTELQEIVELRLELMGFCGRLAAERITLNQLEALDKLFALEPDDPADRFAQVMIDWQFHRLVAKAARNRQLSRMLEQLDNLSVRLLYLSHSRVSGITEQLPEYRGVIEALRNRDQQEAERQLRLHVLAFSERILSMVQPNVANER